MIPIYLPVNLRNRSTKIIYITFVNFRCFYKATEFVSTRSQRVDFFWDVFFMTKPKKNWERISKCDLLYYFNISTISDFFPEFFLYSNRRSTRIARSIISQKSENNWMQMKNVPYLIRHEYCHHTSREGYIQSFCTRVPQKSPSFITPWMIK